MTPLENFENDYALVHAAGRELSQPESEAVVAIVRRLCGEWFRVAQIGLARDAGMLALTHIQGAGPSKRFYRSGIGTRQVFQEFREHTGIHAFRLLIEGVYVYASDAGHTGIQCTPKDTGTLAYGTVLQKNGFRSDGGRFVLHPDKIRLQEKHEPYRRSVQRSVESAFENA